MGGSSSPLANVVNSGIVEMNSAHPTFFKMFATAVDGERGERIAAVPVLGNTPCAGGKCSMSWMLCLPHVSVLLPLCVWLALVMRMEGATGLSVMGHTEWTSCDGSCAHLMSMTSRPSESTNED